jgi:hypothetical protein
MSLFHRLASGAGPATPLLLWTRTLRSFGMRLLLVAISGLTMLHSVHGQELLIEFANGELPPIAAPEAAQHSQPVLINPHSLSQKQLGERIRMQIGITDFVELELIQIYSYVNGDISVSARGVASNQDFRLTMTLGPDSLFGYVSDAERIWQLQALRKGEQYSGWVYQPVGLDGASGLANDFVLPPVGQQRQKAEFIAMPLQIAGSGFAPAQASPATSAGIGADNFSVTQAFNPDPVLAGSELAASYELFNSSAESHSDLILEVFFLLEDSELIAAPANCVETLSLSLQQVLRCELGDFLPGEKKTVSITIGATGPAGSQLYSTAVIGELRDDRVINIVEDVRTDTDQDGISDFNEALTGTDANNPASVNYAISTIDVMALYTDGAAALYPAAVETRINQMIAVANQAYRDSGVAINLRPVHHQLVSYNDTDDMDTALDHLFNQSHPAFAGLDALRADYGADLVMLFRPLELAGDRCGLAPVGGFRSNGYFNAATERQYAFSHIAIDCPLDIAVAHELGHNMGLTHSHLEDGYGGTFNFSTGYGLDGQFVTVMAYPAAFNTSNSLARFSDPLAECLGFACGKDASHEQGADAVQSLNLVRHQIANYFPATIPDPPSTSVASLHGPTNAVITIAATRDDGRSFSSRFSPSDRVDLEASIQIDDRHVGERGSLHVLVGEQGSEVLYQLNDKGELERWDGELDSLIAVGGAHALATEEHLVLLDGFQFDQSLVGLDLAIYIGYRVPALADFVYTDAPLSLSIVKAD